MLTFREFILVAVNNPKKFNGDTEFLKYLIHYNRIFCTSLTPEEAEPIYSQIVLNYEHCGAPRLPEYPQWQDALFRQMNIQEKKSLQKIAQATTTGDFSITDTTPEDLQLVEQFKKEKHTCPECHKPSSVMRDPYWCLDHFLLYECQKARSTGSVSTGSLSTGSLSTGSVSTGSLST